MRTILSAIVAAVVIQPFVFLAWIPPVTLLTGRDLAIDEALVYAAFSALFAIPFVLFAGVPAFLLLRRLNCLSWRWLAAIGFVSAAAPVSFLGSATDADWLSCVGSPFYFGIHGLAGATAAFLVWSRNAQSA